MPEKRIQPKAAGKASAKGTSAAAGVQKKSLRKATIKRTSKRLRNIG